METDYMVKNYSGKESCGKREERAKKGRNLFAPAQDLENKDLQDQEKFVLHYGIKNLTFFKHTL